MVGNQTIRKADSTKLRPEQVTRFVDGQPIVWFSVNGCHTYDCTKSDIVLAMATLHDMGIICVDDYYNAEWPGVATGANAYLAANVGLAVAFAYGQNKLFICKHSAFPTLRKLFLTSACSKTNLCTNKPLTGHNGLDMIFIAWDK